MKGIKLVIIGLMLSSMTFAQNEGTLVDTVYNVNGLERIPYYEQLYRFRVWRTVDFREKQNIAFRSPNSDIVKFMLDNLFTGTLKGYSPTDLFFYTEQNVDDFMVKNKIQGIEPYSNSKEYFAQEQVTYEGKVYSSNQNGNVGVLPTDASYWSEIGELTEYLKTSDVPMMTIVEDVIFDRRRSRLYYDVLGFILLDTDGNPRALVKYADFANLVFKLSHSREMRLRNSVQWKNQYNPAYDKNFVEAIKLRLFHGIIDKVENPDDRTILELFTLNNRSYSEAIFERWEQDIKFLEKEHNLWEY